MLNNKLNTIYELNRAYCITETIDDETIIINLNNGSYYNLLGKSIDLWLLILQGVSPNLIIEANNWQSNTAILAALDDFIDVLIKEEIIKPNNNQQAGNSIDSNKLKILINKPGEIKIGIYEDMQELLGLDPIHETDRELGWPEKQAQ